MNQCVKKMLGITIIATSAMFFAPKQASAAGKVKTFARETMDTINTNGDLARALGTLLHIPYIHTLDSTDPRMVRLAGLLAMLPTEVKLGCKFFSECDSRFFQVILWEVPKFAAYSSAGIYDIINVLNPEHMVQERQNKGTATLRRMKIDQSINVGIEFILRIIACVARYKAETVPSVSGGRDLSLVANLTTELADLVELMRLLGRYATYSTAPGCDIEWNLEIKHIETPEIASATDNANIKKDMVFADTEDLTTSLK